MKTDDLIDKLSKDVKPVRPMMSLVAVLLRWLMVVLLCFAAAVVFMGLSYKVLHAARSPMFWFESIALIGLGISAAITALVLSVPGRCVRPGVKWAAWASVVLWLGILVWGIAGEFQAAGAQCVREHLNLFGMRCVSSLVVLSVVPAIVLLIMIRAAAPLRLGWIGFAACLAAAAFAAFGMQFLCGERSPVHLLLWHMLPAFMLGGVGVVLGRLALRW